MSGLTLPHLATPFGAATLFGVADPDGAGWTTTLDLTERVGKDPQDHPKLQEGLIRLVFANYCGRYPHL